MRELKLRQGVILLAAGSLLTLLPASPASATSTCNASDDAYGVPGHYYAGEGGVAYNDEGIEGSINWDPGNQNGAVFQINWIGLLGSDTACIDLVLGGRCSIQTGYGLGNVGGYTSNGYEAYMEEEDGNGYDVNWRLGSSTLSATDNYISVHYVGQSGSLYQFNAYIQNPAHGLILMGTGYFPGSDLNLQAGAEVESRYTSTTTCAYVPQFQYLGEYANGTINGGSTIDGSQDGLNWHPVSGNWTTFNSSGYATQETAGVTAVRTWGGY